MVLDQMIRCIAAEVELQQRRTDRVTRSRATIQTAVDDAVVKKLVPTDKSHDNISYFQSMMNRMKILVRDVEKRRVMLMQDRISWVSHRGTILRVDRRCVPRIKVFTS